MPNPMQLDAPPAQPPAVQAGGPAQPPLAGVGGELAKGAGVGDSKGAVVSMWEVLKKAIEKWGTLDPALGSFAGRMISVGESGLQLVADGSKPSGGGEGAPPVSAGSAKPSGMGVGGFPG